ncbi:TPA: hypothetical protein ACPSKB_000696 [Legionella feeleii]
MLKTFDRMIKLFAPEKFDLKKLKEQYRKAVLIHHPDKGGNAELFKELNYFYSLLLPIIENTFSKNEVDIINDILSNSSSDVREEISRQIIAIRPGFFYVVDLLTLGFTTVIAAPLGPLIYGVEGIIGKYSLSFFSPAIASAAGTFASFAGVGAIALPLFFFSSSITENFIEKSSSLKENPNLKEFLKDTSNLLIELGSLTTAAAILQAPIAITLLCSMIIPTAIYAFKTLQNAINSVATFFPEETIFSLT